MKEIPDKSVDFVLCDPPYNLTNAKWDSKIDFEKLWEQYDRIVKDNGIVAIFCSQPFTTDVINSNRKNFRYLWYWKKSNTTGALNCKYIPMRCIEEIAVFYKHRPTYNNFNLHTPTRPRNREKEEYHSELYQTVRKNTAQLWEGYHKHLLEFGRDKKVYHSTHKPVALLEFLIKVYTNEGETVLDNFMGSGSTGVACVNTNRNFIGIEILPEYFDISQKRINGEI